IIRATEPPVGENLAKLKTRCKMFHVEQSLARQYPDRSGWSTWNTSPLTRSAGAARVAARMFHVEHVDSSPSAFAARSKTFTNELKWKTFHVEQLYTRMMIGSPNKRRY